MSRNDLNINYLLKSGKWVEFKNRLSFTSDGVTHNTNFIIRIVDISIIDLIEIDNPLELRIAFNGNTHKLVKISVDVVNKSIMPKYFDTISNEILLHCDDGKRYEIFSDPHLLQWSKYSLMHQIQPNIKCNPNIVYRSGLVYSLPKEVQECYFKSISHSFIDIRVL